MTKPQGFRRDVRGLEDVDHPERHRVGLCHFPIGAWDLLDGTGRIDIDKERSPVGHVAVCRPITFADCPPDAGFGSGFEFGGDSASDHVATLRRSFQRGHLAPSKRLRGLLVEVVQLPYQPEHLLLAPGESGLCDPPSPAFGYIQGLKLFQFAILVAQEAEPVRQGVSVLDRLRKPLSKTVTCGRRRGDRFAF
jgi:hypothetical protein